MDCRQYQEALSAAALGLQSGAEVQAFRLHLEICEGCRLELARRREFLGALERHLQTQFEAGPSADFNARVRRGIADEPRPLLRPSRRWLPALAGVAALAVVLALLHYQRAGTLHPRDSNPVSYAPPAEERSPQPRSAASSPVPARESTAAALSSAERPALHAVIASRPWAAREIRIDRRELYAVVRLTRSIAAGRVNTAALLDSQREPDEPIAAKPLEIPPLEIKPIANPEMDGDATER